MPTFIIGIFWIFVLVLIFYILGRIYRVTPILRDITISNDNNTFADVLLYGLVVSDAILIVAFAIFLFVKFVELFISY